MDLITHVLIAYAVSFVIFGKNATVYIAAAALAGGLPDADILFIPLYKYVPALRHHGITHSITGITIIAVVGGFLATLIVRGNYFLFLLAMEIGGLLHIALDGFTNFSVPPLSPFSAKRLHANADVAVNFMVMFPSIGGFFLLLYEKGNVATSVWTYTVWIMLGLYVSYILIRGVSKIFVNRIKRKGKYTDVVPTTNPFRWIFIREKTSSIEYSINYRIYRTFRGFSNKIYSLKMENKVKKKNKLSVNEAISKSYLYAMRKIGFMREIYKFVNASEKNGIYKIFWFSPEMTTMNRSFGAEVSMDKKGNVLGVKSSWRKVYF